jgi:hypothetical protein
MIFQGFNNASLVAKALMLMPIAPLVLALAYAIRPNERRLAVMRPLSLAAIFSALASLSIGAIVILDGLSTTGTPNWRLVALGAAETFVPVFSSFACLTLSWLLVAVGMRRQA